VTRVLPLPYGLIVLVCATTQHLVGAQPEANKAPHTDRYGDPLPPGALARLGTVRLRQPSGINVVALSPNGQIIASAGNYRENVLWDACTGRELRRVSTCEEINTLAFSPDGKTFASGGAFICLWEVNTGKELFRVKDAPYESYKTLAFSPDGRTLASGSAGHNVEGKDMDSFVCLWNVETGRKRHCFQGLPKMIEGVAFTPDGKTIAAASRDGTVRLWDLATGGERKAPKVGGRPATRVAFSPDGKTLAWGDWDGEVVLWDLVKASEVRRFSGHGVVDLLNFAPGGKTLAVGSRCHPLRLWNLTTGKELSGPSDSLHEAWFAAFNPDGKTLVVWGDDQALHLWDLEARREPLRFAGHSNSIRCVAFAPDSKTIATASHEGISLWELATGREIWRRECARGGWFFGVAFAPDGKSLACGGSDESIHIWDAGTGRELRQIKTAESQVFQVAFAPDGKSLFSGGYFLVAIWDATTGRLIRQVGMVPPLDELEPGRNPPVSRLCVSGDGELVTAQVKGRLRLWETRTGKELGDPLGLPRVGKPAFAPDGKMLLCNPREWPLLGRWDLGAVGKTRNLWAVDPFGCSSFSFGPTGRVVASACKGDRVVLWDVLTGDEQRTFRAGKHEVSDAIFSPDGRVVVSYGSECAPIVWDARGADLKLPEGEDRAGKQKQFWSASPPE
jgi:WD40 repeat protein